MDKQPEVENLFGSFLFLIIESRPNRRTVKLTLDDGVLSFILKTDKFLSILHETLFAGPIERKIFENYKKIEFFCNTQEAYLYYDRSKNILKEIGFKPDLQRITPKELFSESERSSEYMQSIENEKRLRSLREQYEDKALRMRPITSKKLKRSYYNSVFREGI